MIKTYLDSGVLIAAHRGTASILIAAASILNDPNREFVTSEFVRLEVLPKPKYHGRTAEVTFYDGYFATVTQVVPLDSALVQLGMQRAETFGLSAVDALHVAAAETGGAEKLVTAERPTSPLLRVTTIRVTSIHPVSAPSSP